MVQIASVGRGGMGHDTAHVQSFDPTPRLLDRDVRMLKGNESHPHHPRWVGFALVE